MNILSSMSQWSQASDLPNASQESATSVEGSQNVKSEVSEKEGFSKNEGFSDKVEGSAASLESISGAVTDIASGTSHGMSEGTPHRTFGGPADVFVNSSSPPKSSQSAAVIAAALLEAQKSPKAPAAENAKSSPAEPLSPIAPAAVRAIFQPASTEAGPFTRQWLGRNSVYSEKKTIKLLIKGIPNNMKDYAEHLYKVSCLLYDGALSFDQANKLERKFVMMTATLPQYLDEDDPAKSQLYLVVERCFDVFIKMAMNMAKMEIATHTIRFLTTVVLDLNYWEVYNLLRWRPALWQFMTLVGFDLQECYARFMRDYRNFGHRQEELEQDVLRKAQTEMARKRRGSYQSSSPETSDSESPAADTVEIDEGVPRPKKEVRPRKKAKVDAKTSSKAAQKAEYKASARSSNYDPDVVHECQLPAPEDPGKVCLRRFSRKYELIRHQETVHSKKKKLFKCYVCVKQDPSIGPRIFTRHDTLAKHIRVNHRISGKEAKAEVAYSKKHAEIVEEGDITVHVGRRKTKVDFELRAHMEKKGAAREGAEGAVIFGEIDESAPDSIQSGDEGLY